MYSREILQGFRILRFNASTEMSETNPKNEVTNIRRHHSEFLCFCLREMADCWAIPHTRITPPLARNMHKNSGMSPYVSRPMQNKQFPRQGFTPAKWCSLRCLARRNTFLMSSGPSIFTAHAPGEKEDGISAMLLHIPKAFNVEFVYLDSCFQVISDGPFHERMQGQLAGITFSSLERRQRQRHFYRFRKNVAPR